MVRDSAQLDDILRLALPGGTKVISGHSLTKRPVSWACSLRPSPPAFPNLAGNELALVDMEDLRKLDPRMRLDRVVVSLSQARVAALAVRGEIPEDAVEAAEHSAIPLLSLPSGESLQEIERSVIRLIVDREGYLAGRAAELQRDLTQIELDGGGLDAISDRIAHFSQLPIVFLMSNGQMVADAGLAESPRLRERILTALPNVTSLRSWAAGQPQDALMQTVGRLPLTLEDLPYSEALLSAIVAAERIQGYVLLLRRREQVGKELATYEELGVIQGARAAALEWSRRNAVGAAEERMRAAFLDELLASEIADEEAWVQRGTSLGFDLSQPHVAWLIDSQGISDLSERLSEFTSKRRVQVLMSKRSEGTLLFWPSESAKSGRHFKTVADELVSSLQATAASAQLIIGISRPATHPSAWLASLQQAREAWRMGRTWGSASVTYFGDLGQYELLSALSGNREAHRFFRKTLQPLLDYDAERNADLVETLEAFFLSHGNLSQTANRLHVHRNTLSYRLTRIAAITRLDLDDADARFALQLALRLRPVVER